MHPDHPAWPGHSDAPAAPAARGVTAFYVAVFNESDYEVLVMFVRNGQFEGFKRSRPALAYDYVEGVRIAARLMGADFHEITRP